MTARAIFPSTLRRFVARYLPELTLVAATMVWGWTFLITQRALADSGPLFFVGLRFAAAALLLAMVNGRRMKGITRPEWKAGLLVGGAMMLGYTLQGVGLQTIPSSKSAFITALYVPLVPLLMLVFLRKPPRIMAWIGVGVAFVGLALLAGPQDAAIKLGKGEIVTLIGAVAMAGEILLISAFASQVDARRVAVIQLAVVSLLAFAAMLLTGEKAPTLSANLLISAIGLGVASAFIQVAMNWAQRTVPATRATFIYASEPVWAGLVGRVAGERLPPVALLGAALIVASVIISELKLRRVKRQVVEA